MKTLNLKALGKQDISFYLALETYLLPKLEEDLFFLWDLHKAVICGKNQLIPAEVNLEYTKKQGIKVFRRHTGGGAVYADEGCFMYTFLSKKRSKDEVYQEFLPLIKNALMKLGLEVEFSGRNDLLFKEKKFSGTAFLNNQYGSILHGTLMYDTSIENLVKSLTPDQDKLISKGISSVKQRVINLKDYLDLDIYSLMEHIYDFISSEEIFLNDLDLLEVKEIERKYLLPEFLEINPPYTFRNKKRFSWGSVEVFMEIKKNNITSFQFTGDFFTERNLNEFYQFFYNQEFKIEKFQEILSSIDLGDYLVGARNEDLLDLVWR